MPSPDPHSLSRQTWADYLDILRRRRRIALLAGLLVVAGAASFALGLPPLYQASATILVEGAMRHTLDQPATGEIDARLQAIKQEALSRARLTDLITRFNLYPRLRDGASLEPALDQIQRDIRVESTSTEAINGQTSTIAFKLTYVGNDAKTTADVTNALASFYVAQNTKIRAQQASLSADSARAQMADLKGRLDAEEARVRAYTEHTGGPQQTDVNIAALTRLTDEFRMNSEQQMRLMDRRNTIQNQLAMLDYAPTAVPGAMPSTAEARLEQAKKQLADLQLSGATDQNPDVKSAKRDIASLTAQVEKESKEPKDGSKTAKPSAPATPLAALQASLKDTDDQITKVEAANKSLKTSIDSLQSRVEGAPSHVPDFEMMMRDYTATRDLYDDAQKRYSDAQLAVRTESMANGEEYRVLDPAVVPNEPVGPNRLHLVGLAALLALLIAVGAAVLSDRLDTSFHAIDDLRAFTRVPVLTSIPPIRTTRDNWSNRGKLGFATAVSIVVIAGVAFQAFYLGHRSEEIARLLLRVS